MPLFQNESKCETFHMPENEFSMQFHFHANQSHFHNNGFAFRLALKQRHKGTRKWPIAIASNKLLVVCRLCECYTNERSIYMKI